MLWEHHPYLMRLLVEKAPSLIPPLLDGHMWTSRFIEDGKRRVNFYIAELYGNPETTENVKVYNTMLGVFVTRLPLSNISIFAHPVVNYVVEAKWEMFGKRQFAISQLLNWSNLALSTAYLQVGASDPRASFCLGLLQLMVGCTKLLIYGRSILGQMRERSGEIKTIGTWRVLVPYLAMDVFVTVHILSAAMCVAHFAYTWVVDPFGWRMALLSGPPPLNPSEDPSRFQRWADIAAFTTGLLWIQVAEGFKATNKLSALLYAFLSVLGDVGRFMLVLGVWLVGFSSILYWLLVGIGLNNGLSLQEALGPDLAVIESANLGELLFFAMMSCLGLVSVDVLMEATWAVRLVFAICAISSVVVMLNLLVSTMVNTYDALQQNCDELAVKSRAILIVNAEEGLSLRRRVKLYKSLGLENPLDFEHLDKGPSGGVQVKMHVDDLTHPSFKVLDRLERYSGPTGQEVPWDPATKQCNTFQTAALRYATPAKGVDASSRQLADLHGDILAIKRKLGILDDEVMSTASGMTLGRGAADDSRPPQSSSSRGQSDRRGSYLDHGSHGSGSAAGGGDEKDEAADLKGGEGRIVGLDELEAHGDESSLWLLVGGVVRDCTSLLGFHPGGRQILLRQGGRDATDAFYSSHLGPSWTAASAMLRSMPLVGWVAAPQLPNQVGDEASSSTQTEKVIVPPVDLPAPARAPSSSGSPSAEEPVPEPLHTTRDILVGLGTQGGDHLLQTEQQAH